jgi:hypothetical protein
MHELLDNVNGLKTGTNFLSSLHPGGKRPTRRGAWSRAAPAKLTGKTDLFTSQYPINSFSNQDVEPSFPIPVNAKSQIPVWYVYALRLTRCRFV